MTLPDGQPLLLNADVLHESSGDRLILWLPMGGAGVDQRWERIGTVVRAKVAIENRICWVEATSVPARQVRVGVFRKLRNKLTGADGDRLWTLPTGALAEPNGPRQTDLRLAWTDLEAGPVDESTIKACWPESRQTRCIGPNLWLVWGATSLGPPPETEPQSSHNPDDAPRVIAQRALDLARAANEPARVVIALSDLGMALLVEGNPQLALVPLKDALTEAQQLGDPILEADAASNLASGLSALGQPKQARDLLVGVLNHTRKVGDRYAEKLALDRFAKVLLSLGDRAGALHHIEQALAIATEMADRPQMVNLLWRAAIEHAELGRRETALSRAEIAVDVLRRMGHPTAEWYAHHLANFRSKSTILAKYPSSFGSIDVAPHISGQTTDGPSVLRMAFTATKAMAAFVGSGFKATSTEAYRTRLSTCATCEHHTGVRCRICGCITAAKAKILHEKCPTGRWPT